MGANKIAKLQKRVRVLCKELRAAGEDYLKAIEATPGEKSDIAELLAMDRADPDDSPAWEADLADGILSQREFEAEEEEEEEGEGGDDGSRD